MGNHALFPVIWLVSGPLLASAIAFVPTRRPRLGIICAWAFWPSLLMMTLMIRGLLKGDPVADWTLAWVFTLFYQAPWWLLTLLPFKLVRRLRAISRWEA